jgi:starch synthase
VEPLKVLVVSSEATPFAKTGGLADVASALARHLVKAGHDARLFVPMYRRIRNGNWDLVPETRLQDVPIELGTRKLHVSVSLAPLRKGDSSANGAQAWFVRCPELYDREGIYTQDGDEHLRFALLGRAALAACQWTGWAPDIVHCNDWHTGLVPIELRHRLAWDRLFERTRSVLTLHNVGYQGTFGIDVLADLDLQDKRHLLWQEDLQSGRVNFLKTGILYADALTTVSRTYAREIQGDEQGMGLQGLLRTRADHLFGIVNGVDYAEWNPATDPKIPARYSPKDLRGKARCKQALLERFQVPLEPRRLLIGAVSRLTHQKGFELLPDILPVLLQQEHVAFVCLGSGEERYETYFQWLRDTYRDRVGFYRGYSDELAHAIEAACDCFVMPSRYEPCGLNQMYSLKYGTLPIVRRTGGLADTVEDYDPRTGAGTGFVFDEFSSDALWQALRRALDLWRDPAAWKRVMLAGMARDFSWERQIQEYVALYRRLCGR